MIPRYQRDAKMFDQGFSGNTIEMDQNAIDDQESNNKTINNKNTSKYQDLESKKLEVPEQAVTDLIGTKQDDIVNAAKA